MNVNRNRCLRHTASTFKVKIIHCHINIRQVNQMDMHRSDLTETSVIVVAYKVFIRSTERHLV